MAETHQTTCLNRRVLFALLVIVAGSAVLLGFAGSVLRDRSASVNSNSTPTPVGRPPKIRELGPPMIGSAPRLTVWWDSMPDSYQQLPHGTPENSNVTKADYVGSERCQKCHKEKHESWSKHPHRWMNATATDETVRGDFSGNATISYMGGTGYFYREKDERRMKLVRDGTQRVYTIKRTIGSRHYQYYTGVLLEGPEPKDHLIWMHDHVLPFGYWLSKNQWVPAVHLDDEPPDGQRSDPFSDPLNRHYNHHCAPCHTTIPVGDRMVLFPFIAQTYSPHQLHLDLPGYLSSEHPDLMKPYKRPVPLEAQKELDTKFHSPEARTQYPVQLGISCEACHNGCRQHVAASQTTGPRFFPSGEHLFIESNAGDATFARTQENVNWICGRCHSGTRPLFAAGTSTWNSTEHTDARRGACYSKLTCIHCHDPHIPLGPEWSLSPTHDDESCLACHQELSTADAQRAHTHHDLASSGSRCMNCHMPKINEGLNAVVRTHTIFSPTNSKMIEANQPNACNLCHLDKSIDWTIGHLKEWYRAHFNGTQIAENYSDMTRPVGVGWLQSDHEPTRMVAVAAFAETGAKWGISQMIDILDDPFLLNRQFAQMYIEKMVGDELLDYGYRFYQTPEERKEPIRKVRESLVK